MSIRQRIEVAVIRLLLERAKAAGIMPYSVDDGEQVVKTPTAEEMLKEVFNLDDCYIRFREGKKAHWARIVLGEGGDDCICDYGTDKGKFDAVMEEVNWFAQHGAISFTRCSKSVLAWDHGPSNRGVCITCGEHHEP